MIRNYLKIAFRNLVKSKGYSLINIVGLAVGIACTILIFLVVRHETSYDLSQSKGNRIYRVEQENIRESQSYPGTYTGMANALRADIPEAELTVPFLKRGGNTFSTASNDKRFKETFAFTDHTVFQLLDYEWISGNANHSILLKNGINPKKLTSRFSSIVFKYMGKETLSQKRFF